MKNGASWSKTTLEEFWMKLHPQKE